MNYDCPQTPCWSEAEIPSPGTLKPSDFCKVEVDPAGFDRLEMELATYQNVAVSQAF
jgi:hypothetical protein